MHTKRKIALLTLGCSKNTTDSEALLAQFKSESHISLVDPKQADTLIINTCGFIQDAKQESIQAILEATGLKKDGQLKQVFVMGCLSERYASDLKTEIPEVDGFFGVHDQADLIHALGLSYKTLLIGERELLTPLHFAYLKISEGCNHPCSFCAIPLIRGNFQSKPMPDLLKEAARLKEKGVKELNLIAQDTTYYGSDLYGKKTLAELLKRLSDLEFDWIRLLYAFPSQFPMDILPVMRERENICKYIDLPLQHINDEMLRSMQRGISKRQTEALIARIREEIPGVRLRTTFIAGYPNETEAMFEELCEFVQDTRFDRLGCFSYSHEEDTAAYKLTDNTSPEEKQRRVETLMGIQESISYEHNQALVGKTLNVVIDRFEEDVAIGRTQFDAPEVDNECTVPIKENSNIEIGKFYPVKVTSAEAFDLFGKVCKSG